MRASLERFFGLEQRGTDLSTEVTAGVTTFLTMAYIVFVNPQILADAGMPFDAVFVATCLAAAFATLVMGLYANYPIALAPGMGLNAFFAYGVVLGLGHPWETALAAVFVSGIVFLALSVLPVRRWIIEAIPQGLKLGHRCRDRTLSRSHRASERRHHQQQRRHIGHRGGTDGGGARALSPRLLRNRGAFGQADTGRRAHRHARRDSDRASLRPLRVAGHRIAASGPEPHSARPRHPERAPGEHGRGRPRLPDGRPVRYDRNTHRRRATRLGSSTSTDVSRA